MNVGRLLAALVVASSCGSTAPRGSAQGPPDGAVEHEAGTVAAALGAICAVRDITEMCSNEVSGNQDSPCDVRVGPCGGFEVWSIRWTSHEVDLCVYDAQTGKVVDALVCDPATMNLCATGLGCGAGAIAPMLPAACALPPDEPNCMNVRPEPT